MITQKIKINNKGFAAIFVLILLMTLALAVTYSLSSILITRSKISSILLKSAQAFYSSESGIEDGLLRVMKGYNYTAINNFVLNDSDINQSISQNGDLTTIVSSASYFDNQRKIKTETTMNVDGIGFHYGVQVGEGGLSLENNSMINGNLYSDGSVKGSSNSLSVINGDVIVATGITLENSYSVNNDELIFGKTEPIIDVAQSFKANSSETLSQVSLYIKKVGNSPDRTIRIFTDDGTGGALSGSPTKTEIGSTTLIASKIGLNFGWVDFSFASLPSLTSGQWYWIVIDTSNSNSKYFSIAKDSNLGNGNGISKYISDWDIGSPLWTTDSGDLNFKIWIGGGTTSLETVQIVGNANANIIEDSNVGINAYAKNIIDSDVVGEAHYETSFTGSAGSLVQEDFAESAVVSLPVSDSNIAEWEADALLGGTFSDASHCSPTTDVTLDAIVLDCDFTPAAGIEITINGVIWVKGNINIGIGTGIKLSSLFGSNSGIIIADKPGFESTSGQIEIMNNVGICGSEGIIPASNPPTCNASVGSYILILSTHANDTTYALDVNNNSSGAIFYTHKGIANINNGANLKEVIAYKLHLLQNTSVTYESGLANASFSTGPEGGWSVNSWIEIE